MTQENYNAEEETEELIRVGKLPKPLRLAAMLEKTMQGPLHGKAADCLREMYEALQCYEAQPQQEPAYRAVKTFHEGKPIYVTQPQQEPVAREPNDAELLKAFTRSNNGPNPFYRCNTCGDTEPGVREYLSNHWLKHNNTSPPQRKPLTEFERMQIIGQEFPLPLVQSIVIQKIDSVCKAIEAAHGIKENT